TTTRAIQLAIGPDSPSVRFGLKTEPQDAELRFAALSDTEALPCSSPPPALRRARGARQAGRRQCEPTPARTIRQTSSALRPSENGSGRRSRGHSLTGVHRY